MKKTTKLLFSILLCCSLVTLNGCNDNNKSKSNKTDPDGIMPKLEYTGNLDIMGYIEGQQGVVKDIGSNKLLAEDLTDSSLQKFHAVAKEFNKIYPNITINFHFDSIGAYDQMLINYQDAHNHKLPHIMHLPYAAQEGLGKGLSANLKKYDYMKLYNTIDPACWNYFTFGDFVCAVPFFIYPTGIFVNRSLLSQAFVLDDHESLLDKWTLNGLSDILSSVHNPERKIGGFTYLSGDMTNSVVSTINKTLLSKHSVDLTTPEVLEIIDFEEKIAQYSVFDYNENKIKDPFDQIKTYSFNTNFIDDELYAIEMNQSFCAMLYSQKIDGQNKKGKFDFLPYPKFDKESEFSIGMIAEGLTIGNQCPLDSKGKVNCTQKDKDAEEAAAAFALFMAADTRAVKSIATTQWMQSGSLISGNYETLPVLRKDIVFPYNKNKTENYDEETFTDDSVEENDYQIQLGEYRRLLVSFNGNEGFEEILRIFEEEPQNVYAYNTIPRQIPTITGGTRDVLENWNRRYRGGTDGSNLKIGQVGWGNFIKSRVNDWTNDINQNISTTWDLLQENVDNYYGAGKYNIIG